MSQTHTFKVEMTCDGCSNAVRNVLGKLGVKPEQLEINMDDKTVKVTSDFSKDNLLETIKKTGKGVTYVGGSE